ncbi:hypothetical protein NE172_03580 [Clostridium botulinum]|uniref:Uncharacterized protein n=1 Tax=Clostridium botulinum TaxID=1491 RepID=A0A6B4JJV5_CLOBO|nr:hypothetical protein [Clostridium botulinum]EES49924.1 conserved hypothetical protein [Clostridium botulinum E1 str. 'BoNT E Beluga']MBY6760241.1 hypothetical protein [Clostridium botulinum]MBY6919148.1 hypothetical protein [Clostridium botulinum]MCR1130022.1 hypothetical protein [Clostridium botulinum]NFJ57210.1 hypothetical protein [Clostridium botulinum]
MARKKEFKIDKDDIAYEEEVEECCFTDYIPTDENSIQLFSIEDDLASKNINANNLLIKTTEEVNKKIESNSNDSDNKTNNNNLKNNNTLLFDNRNTPIANGSTPPIDGEAANIKRSYTLRKSTVRKINELKSIHSDINVCVSTIVDIAIAYYHEHIINDDIK